MRLFVALEVPDDVRTAVDSAVAPMRPEHPGLRWVRPSGWHVTLAFVGEVEDERLADVTGAAQRAVGEASPGPIRCRLDEAGHFGRRVLWLGIADDPAGAIAEVGARLQGALADAGLPVDRKDVHPHLTLARTRKRRFDGVLVDDVPDVPGEWTATEVTVQRSHLGRGGARYETVGAVSL